MSERKGTKALELWCKRLVKDCPDVHIDNMTTSWRNGLAFCALVHHFRPDLIDVTKLNPANVYENNQLAFSIAEKHLGIPALLDPEDMVANEIPDRLSILTYLSQFYQRLGHTVNSKVAESESNSTSTSSPTSSSGANALNTFGKSGLDKCAICDLPVYLAQRLIVSQKLYHRRCFRCTKCSGHLNPNSFKNFAGTEFICDSCKNDKPLSKYLNNNDMQMGMLEFTDSLHNQDPGNQVPDRNNQRQNPRPQSVMDKINMFEKNVDKEKLTDKISNMSLKDPENKNYSIENELNLRDSTETNIISDKLEITQDQPIALDEKSPSEFTTENNINTDKQENVYKIDERINAFLKTQLVSDNDLKLETNNVINDNVSKDCGDTVDIEYNKANEVLKDECNVTDDNRLAKNLNSPNVTYENSNNTVSEPVISIPPRRKKRLSSEKKNEIVVEKDQTDTKVTKQYPEHLNPFSDDDDEEENTTAANDTAMNTNSNNSTKPKKQSTNPFGSSDEEEDEVPDIKPLQTEEAPKKRLISAYNPFWSDGEEPTSDEETTEQSSMHRSSITTSTPNLRLSTPRKKKAKAPLPPTIIVSDAMAGDMPSTSMDDVASLSSVSSFNSTVHSDQKSHGKATPTLKKKRVAPTPPDSISTFSGSSRDLHADTGSLDKDANTSNSKDGGCKRKGPAPGLPLPERREVKLQLSPGELQVQLDLLETQQLGLERQGVLIEQMIRDRCEGDDASAVPQEEVEDLVIQLCELVNEKNDLFRKQTELMYIRRQQRLEQEQADIEHEIRVIQSRPAVNRIDADKAREEQLVNRLVEIVRLRDELVQQLDSERRRERQEDLAIAASIASRRAQRNSESNSSSMKSVEVVTPPKKNKVKDKMKKQFKKAKHTLLSKKKDGSTSSEKKDGEKSSDKEKTKINS